MLEVILGRRSFRGGMRSEPIPRSVLKAIISCGLAAPSSKNAQPWRFHVVTDRAQLEELADLVRASDRVATYVPYDPREDRHHASWPSTVLESADLLAAAGAAIFIENTGAFSRGQAAILAASPAGLASAIVGYEFEMIGIGAAIQNMWLGAISLGLQGLFMGDIRIAEGGIKDRLGIRVDLAGVLVIGYPTDPDADIRPRTARIEDHVCWHGDDAANGD